MQGLDNKEVLGLQLLRLDSSWASAMEAVHNDGNDLEQLKHLQEDRRWARVCWNGDTYLFSMYDISNTTSHQSTWHEAM